MDLKRLSDPFKPDDLEWRVQQAGEKGGRLWAMVVAYVDNRAIMDRLDEVVGPENWRNEFRHDGKAILCGLSIRVVSRHADGSAVWSEWITKWDGAEETDIEAVKGGLSGAMKRAAVQCGIGRYLYNLPPGFAQILPDGQRGRFFNKKPAFHWNPPALPKWAYPAVPEQEESRPVTTETTAREMPTASKSAAVAEAVRALPASAQTKLPGTAASLMGYGGQPILRVPVEHLPAIREKLAANPRYAPHVTAIDDYLEAMRPD